MLLSIHSSCVALFNVMRFPLSMLPNVINSMVEANISLQRLNKFLLGKELDPNAVKKLSAEDKAPAIELKGLIPQLYN